MLDFHRKFWENDYWRMTLVFSNVLLSKPYFDIDIILLPKEFSWITWNYLVSKSLIATYSINHEDDNTHGHLISSK